MNNNKPCQSPVFGLTSNLHITFSCYSEDDPYDTVIIWHCSKYLH